MLPSIRHLLDSDPPVSQPKNSFSCSSTSSPLPSSSTTSTAMPSTAVHPPLNQKSPDLKQSDMMVGPEQPYLQRNTPQHRESHHHPHPPYEPLHPPLPHSQFREYHTRVKMESLPNGHSSDHNGYLPSESPKDPAFSPLSHSHSHSRRDPSVHSPTAGPTEESGRSPGSMATSTWESAHSPHPHGQGASPPNSSHPVFSSSHRPPPPRSSPHDPSLTSSASSASPSPSISTTTVMSSTLTTDAITSVTQGTAAASISDTRPAYSYAHGHGPSARSVKRDFREYPGNGYSPHASQTEMADREDVRTLSPTGGLVQHAPKNPPHAPYVYRDGDRQDPSSSYHREQPPHLLTSSYGEEPPAKRISWPPLEHNLDRRGHYYSADHTDMHGGPHSRRVQPQEGSLQDHQANHHQANHHHAGPPSTTLRRPISPMDAYPSGPHSHEHQHLSVRTHSSSPQSPPSAAVSTADGRYDRPHDWPAESDRDGHRQSPAGAHKWRYGSYSPPGGTGAHSAPSPYESHPRQLSSDGPSYPLSSNAHHTSHPSLQQQQPPLPLYDHVRESDQRHHPSHPSAHPSYHERPPVLDQSKRHQHPAGAVTSSVPRETRSPRLMGAQPHGLAARSERLASPSPSHPYHTSTHVPRSYMAHPVEGDVASRLTANGRPQDAQFRSSESSLQGPSTSSRPHTLSFTHSAQPRYPRCEGAPSQDHGFEETLDEGRGHAAVKREPDADRLRDGSWSDGAAGQHPRVGHSKRGAQEAYSEFRSTLSASYWKESQRVIRASVSESDLVAAEASQRRAPSRSDYPDDDVEEEDDQDEVDEDESDQIDELEEDEEEREHIRVRSDEGLQYPYRQYPDGQRGVSDDHRLPQQQQQQQQQQHPYGVEYDQESKRPFAGYGPPRSRDAPPEFSQRGPPPPHQHHYAPHHSHRPQAHSYHGSPVQPQSQEFSSHQQQQQQQQQQQYQSRPMHIPQHPRSYSYPHQHSGSYHQHGGPHYQSLPSSLALPSTAHPSSPKPPNRRGPYLSRQRALLAGLEATSPSSRYQCQYCHKRFSRPSSLRIHTYSHTGERPFKCSEEGCGRQFSVQSNMRRHLRVHRMGRMRPEFPPRD